MHFPEDFSRLGLFFTKRLTRQSMKRSEAVLTISEFSRQEITRFTQTPFDKIRVTPLSADEEFSKPLPGEFIAERAMVLAHCAEPYILMVANSYPHKSLETGVRAYGQICGDFTHRLVIIGKPRLGEAAVAEAIEALPEQGRVVRLNYVMRQDLVALYQGAELFVFPSKYEGFGLPVLEAMCAGIPVVTTREGAIPEVGGDAVVYSEAGNADSLAAAMRRILSLDAAARSAVVEKARARASKFSWEATARETISVCEELVG